MNSLEQIITKQNDIKVKIDTYKEELANFNNLHIEKFTEFKSLEHELRDEKRSANKDEEKIKQLNFEIKNVNNQVSFALNQVNEIKDNIDSLSLELDSLKEQLLENPEVKMAVYAEEKRRVQELKDAKIIEKRELDQLLEKNPKDISEIPVGVLKDISNDPLYKKYDEQISNFTELSNNASNPRAKSSLENKIITLQKQKQEFLISKIKEMSSDLQNSIKIYDTELKTLAVKEAKVVLDRNNESTRAKVEAFVNPDIDLNTDFTHSEHTIDSEVTDTTEIPYKQENAEDLAQNSSASKEDNREEKIYSDTIEASKLEHTENDANNLPAKRGLFSTFKEKFTQAQKWLKTKIAKFKSSFEAKESKELQDIDSADILNVSPLSENNDLNRELETEKATDIDANTKGKEDFTVDIPDFEEGTFDNKEVEVDITVDTEKGTKYENTENIEELETSSSTYTQEELLDNDDIRKKIEEYMNNLDKKQQEANSKSNNGKEKGSQKNKEHDKEEAEVEK